jgi:MFS family permease
MAQTVAGFAAVRHSTMLQLLLVFVAGAGLVRGVGDVVFVTFADERLDAGGGTSGLLAVVFGVGGLVAAASATRLAHASRVSGQFLVAGVCSGVSLAALSVAASYWSAILAFALLGASDALLMITAAVTIQRVAPTDVLARIFGLVEGTQMGCVALGSYLVAVLASSLSSGTAFGLMAALVSFVVFGAAALLRRHGDEIPAPDAATVDRLLIDPVFAGLPAPVIERLALDAERITAPAGSVIVREGDVGDRYYLIVAGDVAFTIEGRAIRMLGADHSFGEIALLRDVPRTATATAVTAVELIAVSRDEFLTSVTGHPRSFGTASDVADTWLRSS